MAGAFKYTPMTKNDIIRLYQASLEDREKLYAAHIALSKKISDSGLYEWLEKLLNRLERNQSGPRRDILKANNAVAGAIQGLLTNFENLKQLDNSPV